MNAIKNNIPLKAYIYEISTRKIILEATENDLFKHVETVLIDQVNKNHTSKAENEKYGIFVEICPCQSCLEYIILNRFREVSFFYYNNNTSLSVLLEASIKHKIVFEQIVLPQKSEIIQKIQKVLRK